eukprot:TRINITY_DN5494_c0_g1_i1.p1 TRINITY_DN5494_c0_g1~~TRINITY_DN5494_c0_g1_i1.p1  ORF type:complete len:500 (+),score=131.38 TRINITY_DN5494_c0_g1_i1:106-1500(+)
MSYVGSESQRAHSVKRLSSVVRTTSECATPPVSPAPRAAALQRPAQPPPMRMTLAESFAAAAAARERLQELLGKADARSPTAAARRAVFSPAAPATQQRSALLRPAPLPPDQLEPQMSHSRVLRQQPPEQQQQQQQPRASFSPARPVQRRTQRSEELHGLGAPEWAEQQPLLAPQRALCGSAPPLLRPATPPASVRHILSTEGGSTFVQISWRPEDAPQPQPTDDAPAVPPRRGRSPQRPTAHSTRARSRSLTDTVREYSWGPDSGACRSWDGWSRDADERRRALAAEGWNVEGGWEGGRRQSVDRGDVDVADADARRRRRSRSRRRRRRRDGSGSSPTHRRPRHTAASPIAFPPSPAPQQYALSTPQDLQVLPPPALRPIDKALEPEKVSSLPPDAIGATVKGPPNPDLLPRSSVEDQALVPPSSGHRGQRPLGPARGVVKSPVLAAASAPAMVAVDAAPPPA